MSQILQNIELASLTSFQVGGKAQFYLKLTKAEEFPTTKDLPKPWWFLGSGSNLLISDQGLPGTTFHFRGGQIIHQETEGLLIADSGVIWDDFVDFALKHKLWGIELMSGIPGTVGGATAININAYGQALSDTLKWVEVYNLQEDKLLKINFKNNDWGYKESPLSKGNFVILRTALRLNKKPKDKIKYTTALSFSKKHGLDADSLEGRRQIILGVRAEAGSLLNDTPVGKAKTCGSFFRNPLVKSDQVEKLIAHDETAFSKKDLLKMNKIHGGQSNRVSAAHVLLASGFKRGQTFGRVRLHPSHVLKIENFRQASAQEIYDVGKSIQRTVKMKLAINLDFEVATLGAFDEINN